MKTINLPLPNAEKLRAMKPGDTQVFRLGEKAKGHSCHQGQTLVSMFCSRSGMKVHQTIVVLVTTTPNFESIPALLVCCVEKASEKAKRGPKTTRCVGSIRGAEEAVPGHTGESLQTVADN